MVSEVLKSIQPDVTITGLKQNSRYNFELKLAQSSEWNYQLLFTDGLSNYEQQVKEGFEPFKKIELYFLLPDYWKLNESNWPVEWLDRLGALPQKNETWFGPGDTIPAGNPPEVLMNHFPANHFMLVEPQETKSLFENAAWQPTAIRFFGVVPISQPELDYKIRNSATVLFARLKKKGYTEKLDTFRSSVCRKRILGF